MRKFVVLFLFFVLVGLFSFASAESKGSARPFGFTIGKTSYEEALGIAQAHKWRYKEYEKKQFRELDRKSPLRGKNTFVKVLPRDLEGVRSLFMFFNTESTLDACMVVIDPKLFDSVLQELDSKYELVEKRLKAEKPITPYPYALWQKGNVYIELQKLSPYRMRVVYVEKAVYANYRDFLNKSYPRFRYKEQHRGWMDEL